jgi:predicted glutamine amidotransferase
MSRLVGFIGNRPDLGPRALSAERLVARLPGPDSGGTSWGLGFYQGGEILLKRRPIDDRRELPLGDLVKDLRADVLIAHVRAPTVGTLRTENTHPFRYRQWLFAHTGTIPGFQKLGSRLRDSLPQFLERDIRGDTDSEVLFHLFLSFLHDAGTLDRSQTDVAGVRAALRSTFSVVEQLCAEEGLRPQPSNLLVACSEHVIAVHGAHADPKGGGASAAAMAYRRYATRGDLERLFGDSELGRLRVSDLGSARLTIVGSDFEDDRPPSDWTRLPSPSIATFSRTEAPQIEPL